MNKIAKYLNQYITGAVYGEPSVLDGYSTDRSILKIRPKVVAVPRTTQDIRKLLRFASQLSLKNYKLPVTVRGSGTDKTGAAIGSGMIISMEEMNQIQEIDPRQRLVRLQTGVTIGALNDALMLHGLQLPVSGDPKQTIGGLLGNDYIGSLSAKYGTLAAHVRQAEIVLSSGDVIQTEPLSRRKLHKKITADGFEGDIYRKLSQLISDNSDTISNIQKGTRAGYAAITQVQPKKGPFDLLPAFFGSQGTLGVLTEVIISCDVTSDAPQYLVAVFSNVEASFNFASKAARLGPREMDICDVNLFREALENGKKFRLIKSLPDNGVVITVSLDDPNRRTRARKLRKLIGNLGKSVRFAVSDEENYHDFIELQAILSTYINSSSRTVRVPLVDDAYVPSEKLTEYFAGLVELEEQYKLSLPVFGSVLTNIYSVRPEVELTSVSGRQFALDFLRRYNELIISCGGALAGGSAEGRIKGVFTNTNMDQNLKTIYNDYKDIFDPNHILNPGIKTDANLRATVRALRTSYTPGIVK